MEEDIIALIQSYDFEFYQVVILIILSFILYLIYKKIADNDYYDKLHDLKHKNQSNLWEFVADELSLIEAHSLKNVENILNTADAEACNNCGVDTRESQYNMFSLILERVLYHDIYERIKTATKQNGYYSKTGEALDLYICTKAEILLAYSRKRINLRKQYFPLLEGTEDKRFNLDDAITFYRKVVNKSIVIKSNEKDEIKALKAKYSILSRINILSIVSKLISKKLGNNS